jgi:hypothetical protein
VSESVPKCQRVSINKRLWHTAFFVLLGFRVRNQ